MTRFITCILAVTHLFLCLLTGSLAGDTVIDIREYKTKLYEDRVLNYGPTSSRPVKNDSSPVFVKFRMLVDHLVDFDEPKQEITLFCSIKIIWTDEYLAWNESEYAGLTSLGVNINDIWFPDITLLSSTSADYLSLASQRVSVSSTGEVTWLSPAIITSLCVLDVFLFPFDIQNCTIGFGSFASPSTLIDLEFFFENNVTTIDRYQNNGVWQITNDSARKILRTYSSSDDAFAEVYYHISFGRLSKVYVLSIIFPSVLLSLSTLLIFMLPPESGEKISLGITNLLAMVVFQEVVFSAMPPSGSPAIANTICVMVLISCMAILFEGIAQRMYFYGDRKPVPKWLYRLLIKDDVRSSPGIPSSKSRASNGNALIYERQYTDREDRTNSFLDPSCHYLSGSKKGDASLFKMQVAHAGDHKGQETENNRAHKTKRSNEEKEQEQDVFSLTKDTSTDRLSDVIFSVDEPAGQIHRSHYRNSLTSAISDVDSVPGEGLGKAEIWKKMSISFEKKAACFLFIFILLCFIATVLQMTVYALRV